MTVILLAEGETEKALTNKLKAFFDERAGVEGKPRIALRSRVIQLRPEKLHRQVRLELADSRTAAVVGLVDVFPKFADASEAKKFLQEAVGDEPRFYPHAAQYDVEAWLLPYWDVICRRVGVKHNRPGDNPELVDRERPPSKRLAELYATVKRKYIKPIEMDNILRDQDLTVAASQCAELKSLLNTLLTLGGLSALP